MYYYPQLKYLRESKGLTQTELGIILKTTQQQYYKYEKGIQEIPVHHLITLALYYDVSLDFIVRNNNQINKEGECETG